MVYMYTGTTSLAGCCQTVTQANHVHRPRLITVLCLQARCTHTHTHTHAIMHHCIISVLPKGQTSRCSLSHRQTAWLSSSMYNTFSLFSHQPDYLEQYLLIPHKSPLVWTARLVSPESPSGKKITQRLCGSRSKVFNQFGPLISFYQNIA